MAKNAQIVISHDTNWDLAIWPEDWKKTQNSEEPRMDGRRVFTDKSQFPWASFFQVRIVNGVTTQTMNLNATTHHRKFLNDSRHIWRLRFDMYDPLRLRIRE